MVEWLPFGIVAAAAVALAAAFVRGIGARRGSDPLRRVARMASFLAGLATVVVAVAPPVDRAVEASFSSHMVQHLLLIVVAAPLLALADPVPPIVTAIGAERRRSLAPMLRAAHRVRVPLAAAAWLAWTAHVGVLLGWHLPALFDAAVRSETLHGLEHALFLGTAIAFWWPVANPRARHRLGEGAGILYTTAAGVVGSALGALLVFSTRPWYTVYVDAEGPARALHDQQLAGLLMWIPPSVVYLGAAAALFLAWMGRIERETLEREVRIRAGLGIDRAPGAGV